MRQPWPPSDQSSRRTTWQRAFMMNCSTSQHGVSCKCILNDEEGTFQQLSLHQMRAGIPCGRISMLVILIRASHNIQGGISSGRCEGYSLKITHKKRSKILYINDYKLRVMWPMLWQRKKEEEKKIWKEVFYHRTDLDTHFRGQQSHIMINSRRKGIAPNIAKVTEIP